MNTFFMDVVYLDAILLLLQADIIGVYGRFVVGWQNDTFLGQITIELNGTKESDDFQQDDGTLLGHKAIGK